MRGEKLEVMQQTKKDKKHIQTSYSWINYSRSVHNHDYHLLVFTKSVDCNFRAFWLAPVTQNIRGNSLFWDGTQNGFSFRDSFKRLISRWIWSSCTNKYQERDKIWLVGVYWSEEKNVLTEFETNKIMKNDPRNSISWNDKQTLTKWRLLFTKRYFLILSN